MKKRSILLWAGLLIISMAFSQGKKDSPKNQVVYVSYENSFVSAEESWEIQRDAYKRQLESQGLSEKEIARSLKEYDQQKEKWIAQLKQQRKQADSLRLIAEEQRKEAEEFRKKAEEQRKEANILRQQAEEQRQKAEEQREQANILRQQAEEQRQQNDALRQQADEQRKRAEILRQQAQEQREDAEVLRQKAEEQREQAEVFRLKAEEQRQKVEKWRNSFEKLYDSEIDFKGKKSKEQSIPIRVDQQDILYFGINGHISAGSILAEIFDPNGKKEGELLLEHNGRSKGEEEFDTSGSLNKTINDPAKGEWTIRISAKQTSGRLHISAAQHIKNKVNE